MELNATAYIIKGLIGGFIASFVVYYILSRFVFNKLEVVKASRISLAITYVLLVLFSDYTIPDALLFYTPAVVNIFIIETLRFSGKICPGCNRRVKKDARECGYCGKSLVTAKP
ncbi:MAG: hypothetical protein ACOY30_13480 [Bacillota bacterium]